jgi:hypothetical protein
MGESFERHPAQRPVNRMFHPQVDGCVTLHFLPNSGIIRRTTIMGRIIVEKGVPEVFLLVFFMLPLACATPVFRAGTDKNSIPLFAKERVGEVHTIAIPSFFNDQHAWREVAAETASSSTTITIIPSEETESAARDGKKDLASVPPDERPEFLTKIGTAVHADAVLNGLIITGQESNEIILQLISSGDGRILWWQATDFTYKGDRPSRQDQRILLNHMLSQLLVHTGRRNKQQNIAPVRQNPETQPKAEQELKSETQQKPDTQPKSEKKQKPSRKPGRGTRPQTAPDDISPM